MILVLIVKVYINRKPVTGPWGGGNKTVVALSAKLQEGGHEVVYQLCENIDIIFCFDPRPNDIGEWYQHFWDYKQAFGCKIIQRVGDLGTHGKPELTNLIKQTIEVSDLLIFPSLWAKEYINFRKENFEIIENGPSEDFYKNRNDDMRPSEKIRVVTHHWSTNSKKGFKYYEQFDKFLKETDRFEFLYIGRKPENLEFRSAVFLEATGDNQFLSEQISNSHIYLTASEEEAGANHVLEALACGIPVVYHNNGGSIVDYCKGYGIGYNSFGSLIESLNKMSENYEHFKKNALQFNKTIDDSIKKYIKVIENV